MLTVDQLKSLDELDEMVSKSHDAIIWFFRDIIVENDQTEPQGKNQ